jgi:hypothetical protein
MANHPDALKVIEGLKVRNNNHAFEILGLRNAADLICYFHLES